jgi:hypothetical protein
MKQFIRKTTTFLFIVFLLKVVLFLPVLLSLTNLSASFYGKQTNKPRIILVGSSNLDHNYDYELLNEYFNDYDVIGCNLNEPSGVFPTLFKLKQLNPNPDDIIIFCFPHSFYEQDKFFPIQSLKKTGVSFKVLLHYIQEFPFSFLKQVLSHKIKDSYTLLKNKRKSHNASSISFMEQSIITTDSLYNSCWVNTEEKFNIRSLTFNKSYIEQLLEYVSKELDENIYFRFPATRKDDYTINPDRLLFLKETGFFINDFNSSIYQDKYWFNQWYHLNRCGRDISTQKLIIELENKKARTHNNVYKK